MSRDHDQSDNSPSDGSQSDYEKGQQTRVNVLGQQHVDQALANADQLDQKFQTFITEVAWGKLWSDETISQRERSMLVIAILAALGHHEELKLHLKASRNTGASVADIEQVLMHVAVYAGVPAANSAFKLAKQVFNDGN